MPTLKHIGKAETPSDYKPQTQPHIMEGDQLPDSPWRTKGLDSTLITSTFKAPWEGWAPKTPNSESEQYVCPLHPQDIIANKEFLKENWAFTMAQCRANR